MGGVSAGEAEGICRTISPHPAACEPPDASRAKTASVRIVDEFRALRCIVPYHRP
jgi:hypothetical protein